MLAANIGQSDERIMVEKGLAADIGQAAAVAGGAAADVQDLSAEGRIRDYNGVIEMIKDGEDLLEQADEMEATIARLRAKGGAKVAKGKKELRRTTYNNIETILAKYNKEQIAVGKSPLKLNVHKVRRWAVGLFGRWAVGPFGHWAVGPLGRWIRVPAWYRP